MTKDLTKKLEAIVKERYPDIATLESRNSNSLDFHEISVWGLKELLQKAYELGRSETGR